MGTITDSDKFGSVFSCQRATEETPEGQEAASMAGMMGPEMMFLQD